MNPHAVAGIHWTAIYNPSSEAPIWKKFHVAVRSHFQGQPQSSPTWNSVTVVLCRGRTMEQLVHYLVISAQDFHLP